MLFLYLESVCLYMVIYDYKMVLKKWYLSLELPNVYTVQADTSAKVF